MDSQIVAVGVEANFVAIGRCLSYVRWSAPGGDPSSGSGATFATKWSETGTKTVEAECQSQSSSSSGQDTDDPASVAVEVVAVDKVIKDGSDPEDEGPLTLYQGTSITLRAIRREPPKDGAWPPQNPVWTVDPITADNGAFMRSSGPLVGPTLQISGVLPDGEGDTTFTFTAKAGDSSDSIQVILKRCDAITFVSATNDFSRKADFGSVINLLGPKKAIGQTTKITVSVTPNTPASYAKITWEGATVVAGSNNLQATVPIDDAAIQTVKVLFDGHPCKEIWVWPIWVDLAVRINGNLSPDNGCEAVQASGDTPGSKPFGWPDIIAFPDTSLPYFMGGGTSLGPIDTFTTPNFKHAMAGGRVEIVGKVKPDLVWLYAGNTSVKMQRSVVLEKWWDNGQQCDMPVFDPDSENEPRAIICGGNWIAGPKTIVNENDSTTSAILLDLNPSDNGKLFDLDIPGCSAQFGYSVQKTAVVYINFNQWVDFDFGNGGIRCSDIKPWSYAAQVDADAKKTDLNQLKLEHIPENQMVKKYDPR